ncbi:MAG: SCO family protein [Anaerolineae bacterium]|nr:SCO family protein [Anaerolineae bacterium]MCI0607670.1 SCO family protein [Anaerolineae bacterium]
MKNKWIWLILALAVIVGALIYFSLSSLDNTQTYEGTELSGEAPDFHLTDQNGSVISLSDFRGKVVVLTFMDSKCQDTCPLTAVHFREVYRQFDQNETKQVVFLGVNVNVEVSEVADVLETTRAWHLDEIPDWHFLTGSRDSLEPVWKDYGVSAAPSPDGNSIMHTPGVFLIDPLGQERWYVSTVISGEGNTELALPLSELLVKHIREILNENGQRK